MVNINYRADLLQSATISSRRTRCYRQRFAATASGNATTATGNASSPSISVTRRRHRFRQRHDHYRQRFAATASGNATTATGNASSPSLSVTRRRHRFRQRHDHYRQRFAATASGNATTATGKKPSPLQWLPATHLQSLKSGIASAPYVLSVSIVSFSVGHYDVLVSTPDYKNHVVYCVLFDSRRKLKITKSFEERESVIRNNRTLITDE